MVVSQLKFAKRTQFSLVLSMGSAHVLLHPRSRRQRAARIGATVRSTYAAPITTPNETMAAVLSVGIGTPLPSRKTQPASEPYGMPLFMRQVSMLLPSVVTLVGTLVRAQRR